MSDPEPEQPGLKEAARNRRNLARFPGINGFFAYLIQDFWNIRKFAAGSGILVYRFPWGFRFRAGLGRQLEEMLVRQLVIPLSARLDVILQGAWLYLDKLDYNLIAILRQLCRDLEQAPFMNLQGNARRAHELLRPLEGILIFYYKPALVNQLLTALSHAHTKMESVRFSQRETRRLVEKLLYFDVMRPSVAQLLLAAHMLRSRRYLSMKDLIEEREGSLVSTKEYDASDEVRLRIAMYLDEIEKSLASLAASAGQRSALKLFLPRFEDNAVDPGPLQRFLTGLGGIERKAAYQELYERFPAYICRFGRLYQEQFEALLCRPLALEGGRSIHPFSDRRFYEYFRRLSANLDQMERLVNQLPFFRVSRYLDLSRKNRRISSYVDEPNATELQFLRYFEEHRQIMVGLREQLLEDVSVLALEAPAADTAMARLLSLEDPDEARRILGSRVRLSEGAGESSLREILKSSLVYLNLYLYELHEEDILGELEQEQALRLKMQALLQSASRIAEEGQTAYLRKKYLSEAPQVET